MASTSIPPTHRAVRRSGSGPGSDDAPLRLEITTEPTFPASGKLGPHDVLVRVRAVSLNYRDVVMLRGRYPVDMLAGGIAASDAPGDRVSPTFDFGELGGDAVGAGLAALGGNIDGVLREYAVWEDRSLVHLPAHLSWDEVPPPSCPLKTLFCL